MAATSLLALLDDITTLLDDVATMTKTAASKTAGVLGDDLAVNAEQVTGMRAERELPVIWAVFKGALINKVFLVPIALLFAYFAPWLITPVLIAGGLFLSFEGAEKLFVDHAIEHESMVQNKQLDANQMLNFEKDKIKGAIRTDFVLSIEIIVITLGAIASASLMQQATVLSLVALAATVGVYGIVALIVKLDDIGLFLFQQAKQTDEFKAKFGRFLLMLAPKILKLLTIVGTWAMFLVAGGIFAHAIHAIDSLVISPITSVISSFMPWQSGQSLVELIVPLLCEIIIGIFVGWLLVKVHQLLQHLRLGRIES